MNESIDVFLREELRIVNKHLPREQRTLCELLSMDIPYVLTHDGSIHVIDPRELRFLYDKTNGDCTLRLPVIIEYIPGDQGLYLVRDERGARALSRILEVEYRTPLVIHRSQVLELRRILRTSTTILLSPGALE